MNAGLQLLKKPLAEQQRESATDRAEIERNTFTIDEAATIWSVKWNTARMRIERNGWHCAVLPRADGLPGNERRPFISQLPKNDQKLLARLRRKKKREKQGLPGHPGGLVVREDDKRLALMQEEKELIWSLYSGEEPGHQPGYAYVFERFTESCPRCGGEMELMRRGAGGRYKSARCLNQESGVGSQETGEKHLPASQDDSAAGCGFAISYATVRREAMETPPAWALYRRHGYNAFKNKFGSYGRIARGEHRNDLVESDGNDCDILVWEKERPWTNTHQPRLFRPCAIVWQDTATGVVSFAVGYQENSDLVMLSFHHYCRDFGVPRRIKTDNGKPYQGKEFERFQREHQVEQHHFTLPSQRGGESHAKSKAIERWFRTMTEGFVRYLPGWIGSHPKQRQDQREHVLYPMREQHRAFLEGKRKETPFLTLEEFRKKLSAWVEAGYHGKATRRLDCSPREAFLADATPIHRIGEQELQILLLKTDARMVGRMGVSIRNVNYWHSDFATLKGYPCVVRHDPEDLSQAIVTVTTPTGEHVLVALANVPGGTAQDDLKEAKRREKAEREALRTLDGMRQRTLAGRKTLDEVLAEKAAHAVPLAEAVGQAFGPGPVVLPMTEGHRIARALGRARDCVQPLRLLSLSGPARGGPESGRDDTERGGLKLGPSLEELETPPQQEPERHIITGTVDLELEAANVKDADAETD